MTWLQRHLASAERRFADADARLQRRLALQVRISAGHIDRATRMQPEIAALQQELVYREAILAAVQACMRRRQSWLAGHYVPPMSADEVLSPLRVEAMATESFAAE